MLYVDLSIFCESYFARVKMTQYLHYCYTENVATFYIHYY